MVKEQSITWLKKLERTKKVIMVGKISEIYDILTVEEKRIYFIGNKTKRIIEMNQEQI